MRKSLTVNNGKNHLVYLVYPLILGLRQKPTISPLMNGFKGEKVIEFPTVKSNNF